MMVYNHHCSCNDDDVFMQSCDLLSYNLPIPCAASALQQKNITP